MPYAVRVRVFLADDHPLFLEGVADAIDERPELELVGAASNGSDAVTGMTEVKPAVDAAA